MKNVWLFLLAMGMAYGVSAQVDRVLALKPSKSNAFGKDTLPNLGRNENLPGQMPNAFKGTMLPQVLVDNNGKGHDIYVSPIDQMPILKPDSNFVSHMPVQQLSTNKRPLFRIQPIYPDKPLLMGRDTLFRPKQ